MDNRLQDKTVPLFARKDLQHLIIPLIIETFLGMSMGFVNTIMVAAAGQEAVSSVSLVDNINNLILVFVAALATGGAIVIAQYLGLGSVRDARTAAKQLLYTTFVTSVALTAIALTGNRSLLSLVFGAIEPSVMDSAQIYFMITAISYPFLAIHNSVSAVFRSMGISRTPMFITLLMSVINIVLCAVLIYGFGMGVMGAGIAVLAARIVAAVIDLILIRNRRNVVYIDKLMQVKLDFGIIKNILRVGIPSGLDSGMFLLGRLITQSLISTFGTASIAANAVVGQILNIVYVPGNAISLAVITVVGQCVGAGDYRQAASYAKRLLAMSIASTAALCTVAVFLQNPILSIFNLSTEAFDLAVIVLTYSCIFSALAHSISFMTPNILRAAGDVRYTMVVSVSSMWLVRIILSYVLQYTLRLGLMSVWFAMYSDWVVRGFFFLLRFFRGKWKEKRVV